ncbi:MAG TPA: hypothetical protein VLC50_07350 [Actinomycetes bacterium]|nr:hypothetical protein [Actinomycetes bacterium]
MPERRAKLAAAGRPVASLVTLTLAATASLVLAFVPMGTSESVTVSNDGPVSRTVASTTMLQTEGPSVLVALALPVLLAALPVLVPPRYRLVVAVPSAVLLGVFVFLAMFSVGIFFLPAFIASVVAAARLRSSGQPTPAR